MKLIIEIPEHIKEELDKLDEGCRRVDGWNIATAIMNGIPYNPSGDCISREALKKAVQKCEKEPDYQHTGETWQNGLYMAETLIDNAPAIGGKDNEKES